MNLWQIHEDAFDPQKLRVGETIYTIGNGYFGTRGTFPEGYPKSTPATLLYGVFDKIDIGKEELANVPDWTLIKLFVNGERARLDKGKILEYSRTLDMQTGLLSRTVSWEGSTGARIKIVSERFASLADEHVGACRYSVTAEALPTISDSGDALDITIWGTLNTAVGNENLMHWETVAEGRDGGVLWLQSQARHSKVQLVQAESFTTPTEGFNTQWIVSDIAPTIHMYGKLKVGETLATDKIVVMYTSRDTKEPARAALEHIHTILGSEEKTPAPVEAIAALTHETGMHPTHRFAYDMLFEQSKAAWQNYWKDSDVIIEGDDKAQVAMRYNLYQLRISVSSHDSHYSIAAKGLTGFGYRGHIFHDTEIFMLPYFTFVHPKIARNLLLYRYHLLPAARANATNRGYQGAEYPWESTLDGKEATPGAIVHPESGELIPVLNGSLELHITSSIAFAVWHYWYVTGDNEFMRDYGAEMLLSMAMFWASRAENHPEHGDYEITNVIGPDEWHEHVNNNAYTNYMARWNIQEALKILQWLQSTSPEKAKALSQQLALTDARLAHWRDVADHLRIPQNTQTGLFEQFDNFFQLEPLDQNAPEFKNRTTSFQGLMGIEQVQKYQIIKQADVLMLLTILDADFDLKAKKVNWNYYYPITDHAYGSSLTPALHVILASELGLIDIAYKMFMVGALVDLENLRGNTPEGIHDACAGAVWQAAIFGFAGLCLSENSYTVSPSWPDGWTRLAFTFYHKGKRIPVDLHRDNQGCNDEP